jgi:FkbM family methyltransferase
VVRRLGVSFFWGGCELSRWRIGHGDVLGERPRFQVVKMGYFAAVPLTRAVRSGATTGRHRRASVGLIGSLQRRLDRLLPLRRSMPTLTYFRTKRAPPFQVTETELFGKPLWFSNAEGFFHSYDEIFKTRVYDFRAKTDAPTIIDAGANIGLSVIFFKKLYPNCRIIAFEPDPEIFHLLAKNVHAHGLSDVDLREEAAWVNNDELTFYSEGSLSGSTKVDFLGAGNVKKVRACRLKALLTGFAKIDFLKIDIEGSETDVLPDIESELHRVEYLFFEYHSTYDRPQTLGDLLSLATRAGFRYVINGTHGPHLPFLERGSGAYDIQMNISCFRP